MVEDFGWIRKILQEKSVIKLLDISYMMDILNYEKEQNFDDIDVEIDEFHDC